MTTLILLLTTLAVQTAAEPLADILTRARRDLEAQDTGAARRELARARELYPESPVVSNFLGVIEAAEGHAPQAERLFREAIVRSPQYTDAYLNLGRLYQQTGTADANAAARRALAAYQAVLAYAPEHAEARFQSASLLLALGEPDSALRELDRLSPEDQGRPTALGVRVAVLAARGDRAPTEAALDRLLDRADVGETELRPLVPALEDHGRADLAIRVLETLRVRGWATGSDLRELGRIREKGGSLAFAREAYEAAARSRPDDVPLLLDLARVAHAQGDNEGALGYLGHARALEPDNAGVHFFFGIVCVDMNLGAEAYNALLEAVRLDPDNAAINYAMGAVALHRKDPSEAIPYFQKYSQLRPNDPRGPYAIGVAAFRARDYTTAREKLGPAASNPNTAAVASFLLARMARVENDFDAALPLALRAVEANPDYADPWAELGLLYLRAGRLEEAGKALDRCLELDPDHYLGNMQLALLYARTRDPRREAQRARFEAIKERDVREGVEFLRPIEVRPYSALE